jgi:formate hydrogenlyase subunit 4
VKAFFAGRRGPPLLQLYWDLFKLAQKGVVKSTASTWVFSAGPIAGVATLIVASLLLPFGAHVPPLSFTGDLILFAYLLALARFLVTSSALDTGSSFEGMGAAREASFATLAEPALFFGLLVLAKTSGGRTLARVLADPWASGWLSGAGAALVLVVASWSIVVLAENCRIPFDDPNTHLELTMIHEVMVLDHSGPLLSLALYGASLKLFVLGALVMQIVVPFSLGNPGLDWVLFMAAMLLFAFLIGVLESITARLRLVRVPQLLITACLLSAFGLVLVLR